MEYDPIWGDDLDGNFTSTTVKKKHREKYDLYNWLLKMKIRSFSERYECSDLELIN